MPTQTVLTVSSKLLIEHIKTKKLTFALGKDLDKSGHQLSLISFHCTVYALWEAKCPNLQTDRQGL